MSNCQELVAGNSLSPVTLNMVDEARLVRVGDSYWNPCQSYPARHFDIALETFESLRLLARSRIGSVVPSQGGLLPSQLAVGEFPYYVGPLKALGCSPQLVRIARQWARQEQVFLLRGPGFVSILVWMWLQRYRKKYALEILGDYREVFRVINHPLRKVWGTLFGILAKQIVRNASVVHYVSNTLRKNYPRGAQATSFVCCDAQLDQQTFTKPRKYHHPPRPLRISHVGNMEQVYKGHHYLLQAIAICRQRGLPIFADLVGEGRLRKEFEREALLLGIGECVKFHGNVALGVDVCRILDESDLFVFCSLTEGFGKALVETMARGLPAVGTNAGAIPELLSAEALVEAGNSEALALKIIEVGMSANALTRLSAINFAKAQDYSFDIVEVERLAFYRKMRQLFVG